MRLIITNFTTNKKNPITYLIKAIICILISIIGFIFDKKLLIKIIISIFPFLILAYSIKVYIMAFKLIKTDKKHFLIFLVQALVLSIISIYILFNPINTISIILKGIGLLILFSSISNFLLTNRLPILSSIVGLIFFLIPNFIINILQTILLLIILIYGLVQLSIYHSLKK